MSSEDSMSSEVLINLNNVLWKAEKEIEKEHQGFLDTSNTVIPKICNYVLILSSQ